MVDRVPCPYCKGSLFIDIGCKEKIIEGHRVLYPYATPCTCEINRQLKKRFGIFSRIPDAIPEDIDRVIKKYSSNGVTSNIIMYGDESMFLYILKCYFTHSYTHKDYMVIEGSGIVEQYHVPKNDSWLTISTLNQYDLLAIMFTSYTEYQTLKSCIADVVKNRLRLDKPTWIYARDKQGLQSSKEYSMDLKPLLDKFKEKDISSKFDYIGYSIDASEKLVTKNRQALNDKLGRR